MRFNLTQPCKDCPFTDEAKLFLSQERRQEIVDSLRNDMTFSCHQTVDYDNWDNGEEYQAAGDESHCAGALIAMQHSGELLDNFPIRLAIGARKFDPKKLKECDEVTDLDEFCS